MEQKQIEVCILGNTRRFVVQTLIRVLQESNLKTTLIDMDSRQINNLPDHPVQLILCLSDDLDTQIIHSLAKKVERSGLHLYLVGKPNKLSIEEETLLKECHPVHFPSWTMNIKSLIKTIETNSRERKSILIVDDEPMLLRSMKALLKDEYEVYLVSSGAAALDFIVKQHIDLILLDYEMPEMTGPDVLRIIRFHEETKKIPVIFLTAKDDKKSVMSVIDLKPEGYILKSHSPEEIKKTIREFFKRTITV